LIRMLGVLRSIALRPDFRVLCFVNSDWLIEILDIDQLLIIVSYESADRSWTEMFPKFGTLTYSYPIPNCRACNRRHLMPALSIVIAGRHFKLQGRELFFGTHIQYAWNT
jgi:hypothetical protein